jgi:hypothetical protein
MKNIQLILLTRQKLVKFHHIIPPIIVAMRVKMLSLRMRLKETMIHNNLYHTKPNLNKSQSSTLMTKIVGPLVRKFKVQIAQ